MSPPRVTAAASPSIPKSDPTRRSVISAPKADPSSRTTSTDATPLFPAATANPSPIPLSQESVSAIVEQSLQRVLQALEARLQPEGGPSTRDLVEQRIKQAIVPLAERMATSEARLEQVSSSLAQMNQRVAELDGRLRQERDQRLTTEERLALLTTRVAAIASAAMSQGASRAPPSHAQAAHFGGTRNGGAETPSEQSRRAVDLSWDSPESSPKEPIVSRDRFAQGSSSGWAPAVQVSAPAYQASAPEFDVNPASSSGLRPPTFDLPDEISGAHQRKRIAWSIGTIALVSLVAAVCGAVASQLGYLLP